MHVGSLALFVYGLGALLTGPDTGVGPHPARILKLCFFFAF